MLKRLVKFSLLSGIPFGTFAGIYFFFLFRDVMISILSGVGSGALFGLIFGAAISIFIEVQTKKFKQIGAEVTGGKEIIWDDGANHFKGREGVGGWLFLTPDELIFKSHSFNIQNHETFIALAHIAEIKIFNNMRFVPNGLQIALTDGTVERFVVNNRKNWMEKINQQLERIEKRTSHEI